MTLKEFFVKLGLDVDAQSFARGQLAVNGLQSVLGLLARGAQAAGRWLSGVVTDTAAYGDHFAKLSAKVGVSSTSLQELAYAGKLSGVEVSSMGNALKFLNKNMEDAASGGKETKEAFSALGVKVTGANGGFLAAEDVLEGVADKFKSLPDGAEKTAIALKIFGKSGADLIPFLNEGADGIARLRQEAHDLGIVLDEDQVKASVEAADAVERLESAYKGVKMAAGAALLEPMKALADAMTAWVKANRELIKQRIVAIIKALGVVFKALWLVLKPIVRVLGFVIDHLAEAAAIIGGLLLASLTATTFAAANAAGGFLAMGLAAAKSGAMAFVAWLKASVPVLALAAVFALVILLVEDLYTALKGGDSLVQKIWDKWEGFITSWYQPHEGDPWWKKALRFFVYAIMNIGQVWDDAIEFWERKLGEFFDWVATKWDNIRDVLPEALGGKGGGELAADISSGKKAHAGGMALLDAFDSSGAITDAVLAAGRQRVASLGPEGAIGSAVNRYNASKSTTVNAGGITIVTPDPSKAGEVIEQKLREMEDRANRALSDGVD